MITGLLQNKYICISNTCKSKAQIKDLTRISHISIINYNRIKKYSITKLRQVTGRMVDLWSALGPAATFVYNKSSKKETKV